MSIFQRYLENKQIHKLLTISTQIPKYAYIICNKLQPFAIIQLNPIEFYLYIAFNDGPCLKTALQKKIIKGIEFENF